MLNEQLQLIKICRNTLSQQFPAYIVLKYGSPSRNKKVGSGSAGIGMWLNIGGLQGHRHVLWLQLLFTYWLIFSLPPLIQGIVYINTLFFLSVALKGA